MTTTAQTDSDFAFKGVLHPAAEPADELGPLAQLIGDDGKGDWHGHGFNTIWRPHPLAEGGQDRFLELNLTTEKLAFEAINGKIPNRGLEMANINMFGLTYMQQIKGDDPVEGLHIEPGIWVNIPPTTNPAEPATVARMASIPHGTTILAQGTELTVSSGPEIKPNNIIPFPIGSTSPPNSDFATAEATFTELNLEIPTEFRQVSAGVTRAMVENPNSVLQSAIAGQNITSTTVLIISTAHAPVAGGGTANTAFLEAASAPPGGNAKAVEVSAIFWIETVAEAGKPDKLQLQYTQLVQLDFNGLRWPHVSVATLHKLD
ncbi:MAG TPA: heme-binding protein [Solirubrobacteraceae bacterium]